eukprot:TRINITY_DN4931_c0_g1_i1.p3 TRINITY_DN4931_c0_g1~~TRINITY_DN4931_c0_g1_i1.p3  ORF type:complete len:122 (-),score=32.12 TRINITY_DN4931_c0_g1_i1:28-393(-)
MSAWSHLTRVRDAWDYTLAGARGFTHLALVDDDTFVFPGALPAAVGRVREMASGAALAWGGALELPRVDNGDGGVFCGRLFGRRTWRGGGAVHAAGRGGGGGKARCRRRGRRRRRRRDGRR